MRVLFREFLALAGLIFVLLAILPSGLIRINVNKNDETENSKAPQEGEEVDREGGGPPVRYLDQRSVCDRAEHVLPYAEDLLCHL